MGYESEKLRRFWLFHHFINLFDKPRSPSGFRIHVDFHGWTPHSSSVRHWIRSENPLLHGSTFFKDAYRTIARIETKI